MVEGDLLLPALSSISLSSIIFSSEDKQCCGSNINGCVSEVTKANIGRITAMSGDTENHRLIRNSGSVKGEQQG